MFTGIIEELGIVDQKESIGGGIRFRIAAPQSAKELRIHDSVAINGTCHTVIRRDDRTFDVDSVEETLLKTSLGKLSPGSRVNLELPLKLQERLGGHLVMGHVDTTGVLRDIEPRSSSWLFSIEIPPQFRRYIIPVGSITIDGVSLTVASSEGNLIRVSIIPHTMENTIFKFYKHGDTVNVEFDMLGKYVERLLSESGTIPGEKSLLSGKARLNENELKEMGF